jgi:hypothetical protein
MNGFSRATLTHVLLGLIVLTPCASAGEASGIRAQAMKPSRVERKLVALKARVMSADYAADLAALGSIRGELAALRPDRDLGYLADYWSGYASWRLAMNGANLTMPSEEMRRHVEEAVSDFESSIRRKDDFADGYAAAASVHGWMTMFTRNDPAALRAHAERSRDLLRRAKELGPSNPRVLWAEGAYYSFTPPAFGGDPVRGLAAYRLMLESTQTLLPASPLPDWGRAEGYMSLAYFQAYQADPDLTAANAEAQEALRLVPQWSYVREILLPAIASMRARPQMSH